MSTACKTKTLGQSWSRHCLVMFQGALCFQLHQGQACSVGLTSCHGQRVPNYLSGRSTIAESPCYQLCTREELVSLGQTVPQRQKSLGLVKGWETRCSKLCSQGGPQRSQELWSEGNGVIVLQCWRVSIWQCLGRHNLAVDVLGCSVFYSYDMCSDIGLEVYVMVWGCFWEELDILAVYSLIWQCLIAKLQHLVCTLYTCLSTCVYAMYRLYMLIVAVMAEVRRMCHIQGVVRLHVDIRSIIRIWNGNPCVCQAYWLLTCRHDDSLSSTNHFALMIIALLIIALLINLLEVLQLL